MEGHTLDPQTLEHAEELYDLIERACGKQERIQVIANALQHEADQTSYYGDLWREELNLKDRIHKLLHGIEEA